MVSNNPIGKQIDIRQSKKYKTSLENKRSIWYNQYRRINHSFFSYIHRTVFFHFEKEQ